MAVSLVALNGPHCGDVVRLEKEADITYGEDAKCTFTIDDAVDKPLHTHLYRDTSGWMLRNHDRRRSALVNGKPVASCPVEAGDLIAVGQQCFVFCNDPSGAALHCATDDGKQEGAGSRNGEIAEPAPMRVFARRSLAIVNDSPRPMHRLTELARKLATVEDLKTLFATVLHALKDGMTAEAVRICIPRDKGGFQAVSLPPPKGVRKSRQLLAEWVVQRNESILVELNTNPAELNDGSEQRRLWAIGLPIQGRQSPLGAIEIYCPPGPSGPPPVDAPTLDFATAVAQLCGTTWQQLNRRQTPQLPTPPIPSGGSPTKILGGSPAAKRLIQQIERVAPTDATVLTLGESGTGKELVARKIHELSSRSKKPFVAVNCAAFNESLLESELFGHEKGAFTGADAQRKGQFERADKGTIFLDEVGELSAACQAKLLRLLEGQPFARVGGATPIQVDVRILAATHRNLTEMVQQGKFREDLWYRLRVIEVRTPPLRERGRDVLTLAEHFLNQSAAEMQCPAKTLSSEAKELLLKHPWPGNIRELKNAIQRATVLGASSEVQADELGLSDVDAADMSLATTLTLAENERQHIQRVLKMVDGNKTEACRILGIGRATLYSKLSRHRA